MALPVGLSDGNRLFPLVSSPQLFIGWRAETILPEAVCPFSPVLVLHFVQWADWTRGHFGGRVCEQQGSLIPSGMFGMSAPVLLAVASIPVFQQFVI